MKLENHVQSYTNEAPQQDYILDQSISISNVFLLLSTTTLQKSRSMILSTSQICLAYPGEFAWGQLLYQGSVVDRGSQCSSLRARTVGGCFVLGGFWFSLFFQFPVFFSSFFMSRSMEQPRLVRSLWWWLRHWSGLRFLWSSSERRQNTRSYLLVAQSTKDERFCLRKLRQIWFSCADHTPRLSLLLLMGSLNFFIVWYSGSNYSSSDIFGS